MSTCRYEFFKPNDYPSLTITLVKFDSKEEAAATYHQSVLDNIDLWAIEPERIPNLADSASFTLTPDGDKCDECNLFAKQGVYLINMKFKGHYEEVPRARKKAGAIKILKMMYDRIPGLSPK